MGEHTLGLAQLSLAWLSLAGARPNLARPGPARLGPARLGLAWARPSSARLGPAWPGPAERGESARKFSLPRGRKVLPFYVAGPAVPNACYLVNVLGPPVTVVWDSGFHRGEFNGSNSSISENTLSAQLGLAQLGSAWPGPS